MKNQNGFTLIEVMIVVVTVGILASIAIPRYHDHVAKSQMARVVSEISVLKTAVEEELTHGFSPAADDTSVGSAQVELGFSGSNLLGTAGTIAASDLSFTGFALGELAGSLNVTVGGNSSAVVTGASVSIIRAADGSWTCEVDGAGVGSGWKDIYIPAGCEAP